MPDKIQSLNGITVGIGSLILVVVSYFTYIVKSMTKDKDKDVATINKSIEEVKKDIDHHRAMHEDHYVFEKDAKSEIVETKNEVKNVVKDLDRLMTQHDKNH